MNQGEPEDQEFAESLRKLLRESEQIDYVTRAKLSAARRRALDGGRHPRWHGAAISGALAAALLVAVFAPWRNLDSPRGPVPADTAHLEALDILGDEMEPEFYRDLDLYQWLSQEPGSSEHV